MPLRIVMPVSQRDVSQLAATVDLIRALGGVPRHHIMLLPTRSVISHAHQAAERLKAWAASVEVIEWNDENYHAQPLAGNLMWQHAVEENLKKFATGDRLPWFFMEGDVTPLAPGWADRMESEYSLSGCHCMGTTMPSRFYTGKDKDGKPTFTTNEYIEGQPQNIPFMVGAAIYPIDVHALTGGVWRAARGESWDKMLKFYWSRSLHVTRLIQHRWRTINYREENGQIICDDSPQNIEQAYKEAGTLSLDAVVHHGCKDGSLARIIRARCKDLPAPPALVQELPQPRQVIAPPSPIPTLANAGGVKFDPVGWNIVQNSLAQQQQAPASVEPMRATVPALQFEPLEGPPPPESKAPEQAAPVKPVVAKRKAGRPKKKVEPVSV